MPAVEFQVNAAAAVQGIDTILAKLNELGAKSAAVQQALNAKTSASNSGAAASIREQSKADAERLAILQKQEAQISKLIELNRRKADAESSKADAQRLKRIERLEADLEKSRADAAREQSKRDAEALAAAQKREAATAALLKRQEAAVQRLIDLNRKKSIAEQSKADAQRLRESEAALKAEVTQRERQLRATLAAIRATGDEGRLLAKQIQFRINASNAMGKQAKTARELVRAQEFLRKNSRGVNAAMAQQVAQSTRLDANLKRLNQTFAVLAFGPLSGVGSRMIALAGAMEALRTAAIGVGIAFGALLAGIAGFFVLRGLVNFVKDAAEEIDKLEKQATRLNVSLGELQELNFAARLSGLDDAGRVLERIGVAVGEAAAGTKEQVRAFDDLGISLDQFRRKSPAEQINELSDAFVKLGNAQDQARFASDLFGKKNLNTLNFLLQTGEGIRSTREEFRKLGISVDEASGPRAEALIDNLERLRTVVSQLGRVFAVDLIPQINVFLVQLVRGLPAAITSVIALLERFDIRLQTAAAIEFRIAKAREELSAGIGSNDPEFREAVREFRGLQFQGRILNKLGIETRDAEDARNFADGLRRIIDRLKEIDAATRQEKIFGDIFITGIQELIEELGLGVVAIESVQQAMEGIGAVAINEFDQATAAANNFIDRLKARRDTAILEADLLDQGLSKERIRLELEFRRLEIEAERLKLTGELGKEADRAIADLRAALGDLANAKEARSAADKLAELFNEPFKQALRNIQDEFGRTFASIFRDGVDGFKDFGNKILDIMARVAGEMAALFVFQNILPSATNILAGVSGAGGGQVSPAQRKRDDVALETLEAVQNTADNTKGLLDSIIGSRGTGGAPGTGILGLLGTGGGGGQAGTGLLGLVTSAGGGLSALGAGGLTAGLAGLGVLINAGGGGNFVNNLIAPNASGQITGRGVGNLALAGAGAGAVVGGLVGTAGALSVASATGAALGGGLGGSLAGSAGSIISSSAAGGIIGLVVGVIIAGVLAAFQHNPGRTRLFTATRATPDSFLTAPNANNEFLGFRETPFGFVGIDFAQRTHGPELPFSLLDGIQTFDFAVASFLDANQTAAVREALLLREFEQSIIGNELKDKDIEFVFERRAEAILLALGLPAASLGAFGISGGRGGFGGGQQFFEQLPRFVQFAEEINRLSGQPIADATGQLRELRTQWGVLAKQALEFGFSIEAVNDALLRGEQALRTEFLENVSDQLLGIEDAFAATLKSIREDTVSLLVEAEALGVGTDSIFSLERARSQQALDQFIAPIQQVLDAIAFDRLAPLESLSLAEQQFNEALGGTDPAALANAAQTLLEMTERTFGRTDLFFERSAFVEQSLINFNERAQAQVDQQIALIEQQIATIEAGNETTAQLLEQILVAVTATATNTESIAETSDLDSALEKTQKTQNAKFGGR